jgi:translation initiation factor 2B subunit (eIF-2B alpha/beta/delta family)
MFTEQEAVAKLNEKIAKNNIKPSTSRYLSKIEVLKSLLSKRQAELENLKNAIRASEQEIQRLQGGISVLLELAAEDEGMLSGVAETS